LDRNSSLWSFNSNNITYYPNNNRRQAIWEQNNGQTNYYYDSNGNVTSTTSSTFASNRVNVEYDEHSNLPLKVQTGSNVNNHYKVRYDSQGKRIRQTTKHWDNLTNKIAILSDNIYYYGASGQVMEIVKNRATDSYVAPILSRKYMVYGPTGLIAVVTGDSQGTEDTNYVIKDHLGSTVAVYDEVGSVKAEYFYSPTGITYNSLETAVAGEQIVPFLYRGYEYDWQSKLYNFNGVLYNPEDVMPYSPLPNNQFLSPYVVFGGDPVNN
jgi:hypothetical protein